VVETISRLENKERSDAKNDLGSSACLGECGAELRAANRQPATEFHRSIAFKRGRQHRHVWKHRFADLDVSCAAPRL
jgi:hypothetical protein